MGAWETYLSFLFHSLESTADANIANQKEESRKVLRE